MAAGHVSEFFTPGPDPHRRRAPRGRSPGVQGRARFLRWHCMSHPTVENQMKNPKQQLRRPLKRLLACAACLMACAAPYAAAQVVVVDNSPPDHLNGNNMGFAFQAEDFTLAAGTTLTGVRFWSLEGGNPYRGSISWSITQDDGSGPGTAIASGVESGVTRSALGSYLGLQEFRNDFTLNTPLTLGPGSYWLVLHNGAPGNLGDPNEFLWESAAANATRSGVERFANSGPWTTNGTEHAFQISAVAEPAEVLMLMLGLSLLVCLKRRDGRSDNFS
jgi:hypothetical protein